METSGPGSRSSDREGPSPCPSPFLRRLPVPPFSENSCVFPKPCLASGPHWHSRAQGRSEASGAAGGQP